MFHHFLHQATDIQNPVLKLFDANINNGVANLDPNLTINSITETPVFRYNAFDVSGSVWAPWTYGSQLTLTSTGNDPSLVSSPVFGAIDSAIKFNGGKYFSGNSSLGDVTSEDFVIEMVMKCVSGSQGWISKRNGADGWKIFQNPGPSPTLFLQQGTQKTISPVAFSVDAWHHYMWFVDRSGFAICYANALPGTADSVSAHTSSYSNAGSLLLGVDDAGRRLHGSIAYAAMWKRDSWLDTHLQATIAKERFLKFSGIYASKAEGDPVAIDGSPRSTTAYLEKIENGVRKLYLVGNHWIRISEREDKNGKRLRGFLAESTITNYCRASEQFDDSAYWIADNVSVSGNVDTAPDGTTTVSTIYENASSATHGISGSFAIASGTFYGYSIYAKPVNRNWLRLAAGDSAYCYYNLSDSGSMGTKFGIATSSIEYLGEDWYRCHFVAGAPDTRYVISVADADNNLTFSGLDQESLKIWGGQIERNTTATAANTYATSYIKCSSSVASVNRQGDAVSMRGLQNLGNSGSEKQGAHIATYSPPNGFPGAIPLNQSNRYLFAARNSGSVSINDSIIAVAATTETVSIGSRVTGTLDGVTGASVDFFDNVNKKTKFSWKVGRLKIHMDASAATDTPSDIPTDLNRIDVCDFGVAQSPSAIVNNYRFYKKYTTK